MENHYKDNSKSINFIVENRFIKYCLTGVFNTAHHFVWFLLLSPLLGYKLANLIAFLVANITSFFINSYFTFRVLPSIKKFMKYPSVVTVQAVIAYLVPSILLLLSPESKWLVPILTTIINLPIGYLMTKKVLSAD
ncbi:GtrA family protein [Neobacillus niacini]|uniref:GtrA family protein n=1 Tax=Neobacillus niacini TaxID=86668 RepID=UPI0007AB8E2D|nr:GtrA family protein [Neobacillus niacini]MEC1525884.1 GtrA family protein [Neobacillus niacini]